MIRHTVAFRLKPQAGSPAELDFLAAACGLSLLPGVKAFECLRQIGKMSPFTFALSMEFADDKSYRGYSEHPEHARFVTERWLPEVAEFLELDYMRHHEGPVNAQDAIGSRNGVS